MLESSPVPSTVTRYVYETESQEADAFVTVADGD